MNTDEIWSSAFRLPSEFDLQAGQRLSSEDSRVRYLLQFTLYRLSSLSRYNLVSLRGQAVMSVLRIPDLSAVILAGGNSRRMGTDKALLVLQGRSLIGTIVDRVRMITDEIWISANDQFKYEFLGLPVIQDVYQGQGPLAGLHSGMRHTGRPLVLLLACDLPRVGEPLLRNLVANLGDSDAVIPRTADGRFHPLCGLYRKTCLPAIEKNLLSGVNKMTGIFDEGSLQVRLLGPEEGMFQTGDLCNLNSPEDLENFGLF